MNAGFFSMLVLLMLTQMKCVIVERSNAIFPDDYDKFEPPGKAGDPAHVYLELAVMDVDKIDDDAMEFSIQSYLGEYWVDNRLNLSGFHDDSQFNPIFPTSLTDSIWVPDLVFDNTKRGSMFKLSLPNTVIQILKDGAFKKTSRYNLQVSCPMDFHFYPMDTQECFVKISTLAYPDFIVMLHWTEELDPPITDKSIAVMQRISPLKYTLRTPETYKTIELWPEGNYTYLYANFTFDRRLSGSIFNVYIPSLLVVLLSWMAFWIDVEAVPARVTLGVTSLLTLGTQIVQARSGLPSISYMTAMDVWLFACLVTVFSSLLEFSFAYQIFVSKKQALPTEETNVPEKPGTPKKEIRLFRSSISQKFALHDGIENRKDYVEPQKREVISPKRSDPKSMDKVCRRVFPSLFVLFSIIYWSYYLHVR